MKTRPFSWLMTKAMKHLKKQAFEGGVQLISTFWIEQKLRLMKLRKKNKELFLMPAIAQTLSVLSIIIHFDV